MVQRVKKAFEMLAEKSRKSEYYAALLSSGVSLVDYKRFESCTPFVRFAPPSTHVDVQWGYKTEPDEETVRWVHNFVVTAIVQWQVLGLAPNVPEWGRKTAQKLIEEGGTTLA